MIAHVIGLEQSSMGSPVTEYMVYTWSLDLPDSTFWGGGDAIGLIIDSVSAPSIIIHLHFNIALLYT